MKHSSGGILWPEPEHQSCTAVFTDQPQKADCVENLKMHEIMNFKKGLQHGTSRIVKRA